MIIAILYQWYITKLAAKVPYNRVCQTISTWNPIVNLINLWATICHKKKLNSNKTWIFMFDQFDRENLQLFLNNWKYEHIGYIEIGQFTMSTCLQSHARSQIKARSIASSALVSSTYSVTDTHRTKFCRTKRRLTTNLKSLKLD